MAFHPHGIVSRFRGNPDGRRLLETDDLRPGSARDRRGRKERLVSSTETKLTFHDRVRATLEGRKPDRQPFCDRLELWFTALSRQGRIPAEFEGLSLLDIHRRVGMGQMKFVTPYALRLRGVELVVRVDGEETRRETDPEVRRYPVFEDLVDTSRPGLTTIELRTPVGAVRVGQQVLAEAVFWGETAYLYEHPIKELADFETVHWIIDHAEPVPRFDDVYATAAALGGDGFVVPRLDRIPFQEVLIDQLGEIATFYALADDPGPVLRLMDAIHELRLQEAALLGGLDYPYVELADNLTGHMTNPKLFAEYALPHYRAYAELYHAQGKTMGSHTDGDLKSLLGLLQESGLDVCESFSPAPLTECTFDEAWAAWGGGKPIMWGVFPSPILEERTPEEEFTAYVDHVVETVGDAPVIFGVSDMVLGNNLIERVAAIGERIEARAL
jgi:hypothetical protein